MDPTYGFWEFMRDATPLTALMWTGGYVAVHKDFLTALGVMLFEALVYFGVLAIWVHMEKYSIRNAP